MSLVADADAKLPPSTFFELMKAIGYQPFIMMDMQVDGSEGLLVCQTQENAPEFVHEINRLPLMPRCSFLRGIGAALQQEYFDAGEAFYKWIMSGDEGLRTEVHIFSSFNGSVPYSLDFPAYSISECSGEDGYNSSDRAMALAAALHAYDGSIGNDVLKWCLIEGMALSLSKYFGSVGDFASASEAVNLALKYSPKSIHLRAAEYALECGLRGAKVPDRLMKFIGPDNGALLGYTCPEPFKRFDVGPSGEVLICCGHWVPTSIGNLMTDGAEEILNSESAKKICALALDGSYKYCNHLECMPMIQGYLPKKSDVEDPVLRAAIDKNTLTLDHVDKILFAFDQSCNLSCPSCRRERIIEKPSLNQAKAKVVEEKLLPLLASLKILNINPAGEIFSSKPSRRILELVKPKRALNSALST